MKQKNLIVTALILVITGSIISLPFILSLKTLSTGYLSGTQGLEAEFNSIYWKNRWWSRTERPNDVYTDPIYYNAYSASWGYTMAFNPDGSIGTAPSLDGSQQPMTLQTDTEPKTYSWQVFQETKTLANGTIVDSYKQFEMFRYKVDWSINVWLSGSETDSWGEYTNLELWLKLTPRAFVYFLDNPKQVFFAPAYIGLAEDVKWAGIDSGGNTFQNDAEIARTEDLIPKTQGEVTGIYYLRGAAEEELKESKILSYQGFDLDTQIFRDEYWMRLNLLEFKAIHWYVWGAHNWKFPSANLHFLVYLFVVGEWEVYFKTGEIPDLKPHQPAGWIFNPAAWFESLITNPLFWLSMFGLGTIILIVLLLVFAGPAVSVFAQLLFKPKK
jgi:hypothetical protein